MAELWDARGPPRNTRLGRATSTCPRLPRSHRRTLKEIYCAATGSGWPERLRSHPESLGTRQGPYLRTPKPGFAVASAKLTSWFGVWVGVHRGIGLTGKERAELGHEYRHIFARTENNCSSHLGGPGEPRGATRDPQGRPPRRSDGPDDEGVARRHVPGGERG